MPMPTIEDLINDKEFIEMQIMNFYSRTSPVFYTDLENAIKVALEYSMNSGSMTFIGDYISRMFDEAKIEMDNYEFNDICGYIHYKILQKIDKELPNLKIYDEVDIEFAYSASRFVPNLSNDFYDRVKEQLYQNDKEQTLSLTTKLFLKKQCDIDVEQILQEKDRNKNWKLR